MGKKQILMIGTGGTIACRKTQDGLAPAMSGEMLLSHVPGVSAFCHPTVIEPFSVDSTNMTPAHWQMLSRLIEQHYHEFDGFVICHGTDTLAYTAAALSYMVQNSEKPIVLTGAQKPIDAPDTDARTNLTDSFLYAADDASRDVSIVFDGKAIVGTRAKKERAKSYNAFASINFPYPAVIQDGRVIRYLTTRPCEAQDVRFYHNLNTQVCVCKLIPGTQPELLAYLFEHYDCLVIESFGVGGIPQPLVEEFYRQMERFQGRKTVVMTTQVAQEGSNMTVYEVGRRIKQDFGLLEAYDMTLEAVITKMMWALANGGTTPDRIKELFYTCVNHDTLFH